MFSTPALQNPDILAIQIKLENIGLNKDMIYREFQLKNKYSADMNNFNTPEQTQIHKKVIDKYPSPDHNSLAIENSTAMAVESLIKYRYMSAIYRSFDNYERLYVGYLKNSLINKSYVRPSQIIFEKSNNGIIIDPGHFYSSPYHTPFFIQNDEHVFFVQLEEEWISIQENNDYGVLVTASDPKANIELTPVFELPDTRVLPNQKFDNNPENVDPFLPGYNFGNDNIKFGLPDNNRFLFKGRTIGAYDSRLNKIIKIGKNSPLNH